MKLSDTGEEVWQCFKWLFEFVGCGKKRFGFHWKARVHGGESVELKF